MNATISVIVARYGSRIEEFSSEKETCAAILRHLPRWPDEVWSEDAQQRQIAEYHPVTDGDRCHLVVLPPAPPAPHRLSYESP